MLIYGNIGQILHIEGFLLGCWKSLEFNNVNFLNTLQYHVDIINVNDHLMGGGGLREMFCWHP